MTESSSTQPQAPTPDPNTPVETNLDLAPSAPQPRNSITDKLSGFSDYLSEYPSRLSGLKSFAVVGIMVFGSIAGVVLLKGNLDTRKQASEGNQPEVCKLKDPGKMATKKLDNTTVCFLNGKTYYACNEGYTFTDNTCVADSPAK